MIGAEKEREKKKDFLGTAVKGVNALRYQTAYATRMFCFCSFFCQSIYFLNIQVGGTGSMSNARQSRTSRNRVVRFLYELRLDFTTPKQAKKKKETRGSFRLCQVFRVEDGRKEAGLLAARTTYSALYIRIRITPPKAKVPEARISKYPPKSRGVFQPK